VVVIEVIFWVSLGLILYTHVGYPLLMWVLSGLFGEPPRSRRVRERLPTVTLIVPAHDEAEVIEQRIENALALDYPRDRIELVVASDGSTDRTVELARAAGADLVLDLPRGGKVAALNAAARQAQGTIFAFSDANAYWHPRALRRLVARFEDPQVGYVCGRVRFHGGDGGNQEGLYWRYEMAVRHSESKLAGITGGNGAIYAVRPEAYVELEPDRGQDLSFPFELTKRGWRAVYEREAVADERMAPTVEGEFQRKRRMMWGLWDAMLRYGILNARGYSLGYLFEIYSHRLLRYLTPVLHVIALLANAAVLSEGGVYSLTMALQLCLLAAAGLGRYIPFWPLRVAYYYVTVTAAIAAGFWDRFRAGEVPIGWEKVEGTR
jgi:cellulose synthase/poly-beta-1,6-N-acetylglucosamine synthase-like glycosyltransferase